MRLPFDYVTFSVVGLSAISLSTIFLQLASFPVNADAFYPLRMNMIDIGGKQAGLASYASQPSGIADDHGTIGTPMRLNWVCRRENSQLGHLLLKSEMPAKSVPIHGSRADWEMCWR